MDGRLLHFDVGEQMVQIYEDPSFVVFSSRKIYCNVHMKEN